MRYPKMDDFLCRFIASETDVAVVNVDYDVAPQAQFPVGHEQAHDVCEWLSLHGSEMGLDGSRLAVGGMSSGGNVAASVCLQARDRGTFHPLLQVLGVPALDMLEPVESNSRAMISPALRRLVRKVYFPDLGSRTNPYASPVLADVAGLPPTLIFTAERDVLRAEGDRFAEKLKTAGVETIHDITPNADHYFLSADLGRARESMSLIASTLQAKLSA